MLGFAKDKEVKKTFREFDQKLSTSFDLVKKEVGDIKQWLQVVYDRQNQNDLTFQDMNVRLDLTISKQETKDLIDWYYAQVSNDLDTLKKSQQDVFYRLQELGNRIKPIEQYPQEISREIRVLRESLRVKQVQEPVRLVQIPPPIAHPHSNLADKLVRGIAKKSKEYIKNYLLQLCKKYDKINALTLREMVVEDQKITSKSSFYRLIQELEEEGLLKIVVDKKEKIIYPFNEGVVMQK